MVSLAVSSRNVKGCHLWVCQADWKQQSGIKCSCPKVVQASPTGRSAPSAGLWVPQIRANGTSHFNELWQEGKVWGGSGLRKRAVSSHGMVLFDFGRSCAIKGNQNISFALKTPPQKLLEGLNPNRCQLCLSTRDNISIQRQHPERML